MKHEPPDVFQSDDPFDDPWPPFKPWEGCLPMTMLFLAAIAFVFVFGDELILWWRR